MACIGETTVLKFLSATNVDQVQRGVSCFSAPFAHGAQICRLYVETLAQMLGSRQGALGTVNAWRGLEVRPKSVGRLGYAVLLDRIGQRQLAECLVSGLTEECGPSALATPL